MITWMVETTVVVTVAALALYVVQARFRVPAVVLRALWIVVLLRFVFPSVAVPEPLRISALRFPTIGGPPADARRDSSPSRQAGAVGIPVGPVTMVRPEVLPVRSREAPPSSTSLWWALIGAWVVGSGWIMLLGVSGLRRWARLAETAAVPDPVLAQEVVAVAGRMGIAPPRLLTIPNGMVPQIANPRAPVLLLPAHVETLGEDVRRAIIAHELAHLRHGDLWVGLVEFGIRLVWWWNPVFWLVCHGWGQASEMACDDVAMGIYPAARHGYSHALLDIMATRPAVRPAHGIFSYSGLRAARRRLMHLYSRAPSDRPAPRYRTHLACVGFALLCLPAWVRAPSSMDGRPPAVAVGAASWGSVSLSRDSMAIHGERGAWFYAIRVTRDGHYQSVHYDFGQSPSRPHIIFVEDGVSRAPDGDTGEWLRALAREVDLSRIGGGTDGGQTGPARSVASVEEGAVHHNLNTGTSQLIVWGTVVPRPRSSSFLALITTDPAGHPQIAELTLEGSHISLLRGFPGESAGTPPWVSRALATLRGVDQEAKP